MILTYYLAGAVVVKLLSIWLVEQCVRGSIPILAITISEIGYLLLPSDDMAEIWRKSSKQPPNQLIGKGGIRNFRLQTPELDTNLGFTTLIRF